MIATTVPVLRTGAAVLAAAAAVGGGAAFAGLPGAAAQEPPRGTPAPRAAVGQNPCVTSFAKVLRCPDLVMRRPHEMYVEYRGGHTLLRAGNSIDNIGRGPAEIHGTRIGPTFMRGRQRIYLRNQPKKKIGIRTGARLHYKLAHLGLHWWKFHNAAAFELWRVDGRGKRTKRVRVGPKVDYCLRDLAHTRPLTRHSPRLPVYPACNTSPTRKRVTLGTSPGWSDIYPPTYPDQWIDVTGLRGCFAYGQIADPKNGIYESNEDNNEAQVIVRLPFDPYNRRKGCRGPDRGRPLPPSPYY